MVSFQLSGQTSPLKTPFVVFLTTEATFISNVILWTPLFARTRIINQIVLVV